MNLPSCMIQKAYIFFPVPDLSLVSPCLSFLPEGFAAASQEQQVSVTSVPSSPPLLSALSWGDDRSLREEKQSRREMLRGNNLDVVL